MKMVIAVPVNERKGLSSRVARHFGRCEYYALINEGGELLKFIKNSSRHKGGVKQPPEVIHDNGADALLCTGIGPKAIEFCKKLGIKVFVGRGGTIKQIFESWNNDELTRASADEACEEHRK